MMLNNTAEKLAQTLRNEGAYAACTVILAEIIVDNSNIRDFVERIQKAYMENAEIETAPKVEKASFKQNEWVRCIDAGSSTRLITGKLYQVVRHQTSRRIVIVLDDDLRSYSAQRFEKYSDQNTPAVPNYTKNAKAICIDALDSDLIMGRNYMVAECQGSRLRVRGSAPWYDESRFAPAGEEPVINEIEKGENTTFKVGDKVTCINDSGSSFLIKNHVYTVKKVVGGNPLKLKLEEIDVTSYYASRFMKQN